MGMSGVSASFANKALHGISPNRQRIELSHGDFKINRLLEGDRRGLSFAYLDAGGRDRIRFISSTKISEIGDRNRKAFYEEGFHAEGALKNWARGTSISFTETDNRRVALKELLATQPGVDPERMVLFVWEKSEDVEFFFAEAGPFSVVDYSRARITATDISEYIKRNEGQIISQGATAQDLFPVAQLLIGRHLVLIGGNHRAVQALLSGIDHVDVLIPKFNSDKDIVLAALMRDAINILKAHRMHLDLRFGSQNFVVDPAAEVLLRSFTAGVINYKS